MTDYNEWTVKWMASLCVTSRVLEARSAFQFVPIFLEGSAKLFNLGENIQVASKY